LQRLNERHQARRPGDAQLEARIQSFELAYRMQHDAEDAFDVSREPEHVRRMYGPGVQGRQLLITRRLLEKGVRFVQVWHGEGQPWDSHDDLEREHRRLARECDQAIGALLKDLKQRGMLDDTLVIWGGEFGRTPTVELPTPGANAGRVNGRDHNHYGFTVWLAGGGARGGHVHGATDEFGFRAVENPVHVHDLQATILHLLGFDHERLTYRYAGRDFRLTDVHGHVVRELIA
jgi:arylsulfatase A-like enzyme